MMCDVKFNTKEKAEECSLKAGYKPKLRKEELNSLVGKTIYRYYLKLAKVGVLSLFFRKWIVYNLPRYGIIYMLIK